MVVRTDIVQALNDRIKAADERYGPFASTHEAMGVAMEEWDEFREAVRSNRMVLIESECIDLAAVLIRLAMDINKVADRSTK